VGGVQERFGGNASAIEANASETLVALDEDDFFAEVCGVEGRGVSSGAGADDDDLGLNGIHGAN
jgi:hypothetical protein